MKKLAAIGVALAAVPAFVMAGVSRGAAAIYALRYDCVQNAAGAYQCTEQAAGGINPSTTPAPHPIFSSARFISSICGIFSGLIPVFSKPFR